MSSFATETRKEGSRWHFLVHRPRGHPIDSTVIDERGHPSKAAAEKAAKLTAKRAALSIYEDHGEDGDPASDGPRGWRIRRVDAEGETVWRSKPYPDQHAAAKAAEKLAAK